MIIRPLTQRNRPQVFEPRRNNYNGRSDDYGPINSWGGSGFGRFGSFAGGLATGALLTYLLEQGRIGFDQYHAMQNLEDHELLRELENQNILQQDEINQLREGMDNPPEDRNQEDWNQDNDNRNVDRVDYDPKDQQDDNDFGGWDDNSDDNWV